MVRPERTVSALRLILITQTWYTSALAEQECIENFNAGAGPWEQISNTDIPFGTPGYGATVVVFDAQSGTNAQGRTQRIYVSVGQGNDAGVYVSENAGGNWNKLPLPSSFFARDMQTKNGVLYIASSEEAAPGLYRYSPSQGLTNITPPIGNRRVAGITLDPDPDNQVIYATSPFLQNFYRSTNNGDDWTLLETGSRNEATRQNFRSALAPWKENSSVRNSLSVGQLVIDPTNSSRMWFAEGMGVWRSDDISVSNDAPIFNDVSRGMEQTVANDVVSLPNNNLVVAVSDRIGFHFTDPDVYPDEQISPSEGLSLGASISTTPAQPDWVALSVADNRFVEGGCLVCGEGNASGFSEDGGKTWNLFESITPAGTTVLGESNFLNNPSELQLGEIVISATTVDNMVWVARNGSQSKEEKNQTTDRARLFYTTNRGATWLPSSISTASGGPVGDFNRWFASYRRVLAADQVQGGTFYFYSWGSPTGNDFVPEAPARIFKSTDGGQKLSGSTRFGWSTNPA